MKIRSIACWPLVVLAVPLMGCTAEMARPNPASGGSASLGGAGAGGGAGQSSICSDPVPSTADCSKPDAPAFGVRLLTPSQYEHTVADMLKVTGHSAKEFGAKLDEVGVAQRATAAAAVATAAAANLSTWSPCVPPAIDAATCETQLIDWLGKWTFRRPLSESERAQCRKLFDAGVAEKEFATGVEWLLTGLLQAPDFLYHFALPKAGEVAGQVVPLGDYELASRLSFFLWDGPPDDGLLTDAGLGKLADGSGLDQQIQRMLADPRLERGTAGFYASWLGVSGFGELFRPDSGFTEIVDALKASLLLSATKLYSSPSPNIQALLSGNSYYMNDKVRAFYGVPGGSAEFELTQLPNEGRQGILTHPALMALQARPGESFPISRGLFLQEAVLCHEIPPALPNVGMLPDPQPGAVTSRQRLEAHQRDPVCAVCHTQIDPPGFALEAYDQVGRYRTNDHGEPIDSSGTMLSCTDVDGPFQNGEELLSRIATSTDAKRCFAEHYLSYALLRDVSDRDHCSLAKVTERFLADGDLKQLLVAVASSDTFRLRATEDQGTLP